MTLAGTCENICQSQMSQGVFSVDVFFMNIKSWKLHFIETFRQGRTNLKLTKLHSITMSGGVIQKLKLK